VKQVKEWIHEGFIVPQPFLLELGDDATASEDVVSPDHHAHDKEKGLQPESGVNRMRHDDHRDQYVREEMMCSPHNLGSLFLIGFPEHQGVDRPFRPFKSRCLHCKTSVF